MDSELLTFFLTPLNYLHPVESVRHLETHISHVFLTGTYAYKVKKPVKLPFIDFSTLEKRRYFCEREVLINQRFAQELYEGVVAVTRSISGLHFDTVGSPVEYAVKMREFDSNSLFTTLIEQDKLTEDHLRQITEAIAAFHRSAANTPDRWGPEAVTSAVRETLEVLASHSPHLVPYALASSLRRKMEDAMSTKLPLIATRQSHYVKALHGDLHLRNIALFKGKPILFDGVEFNEELSCCDVWSDIAFLIMDLHYRGRSDLANHVANIYLEEVDDFDGLGLLDFYTAYRAAVRAKVSCLEYDSVEEVTRKAHAKESVLRHIELGLSTLDPKPARLIAVGGLSGTGKSTVGSLLAQDLQGIHIRSDVIRKHLLGLPTHVRAPNEAYKPEVDLHVYEELRKRAGQVLSQGKTVIVDAVHRSLAHRTACEHVAHLHGVPFTGIWCTAPLETALARILSRKNDASDATAGVVENQYRQPAGEMRWVELDTASTIETVRNRVREICRITFPQQAAGF